MLPTDVAHESWTYWRPLVRKPGHAWALLGCESGETSFNPKAVGDHGSAFGPFQWHAARAEVMLNGDRARRLSGCGIDVRTAGHLDQLRAAHFEMTAGAYKRVWPALMATETLWSAMSVLVHDYEQSGNQARDIKRRVALAEQLQAAHGADWEKAA